MNVGGVNKNEVVLIALLASMTPSAATVLQFAQLNNKDADFATAVNIVSTLLCVVTMPLFVMMYGM